MSKKKEQKYKYESEDSENCSSEEDNEMNSCDKFEDDQTQKPRSKTKIDDSKSKKITKQQQKLKQKMLKREIEKQKMHQKHKKKHSQRQDPKHNHKLNGQRKSRESSKNHGKDDQISQEEQSSESEEEDEEENQEDSPLISEQDQDEQEQQEQVDNVSSISQVSQVKKKLLRVKKQENLSDKIENGDSNRQRSSIMLKSQIRSSTQLQLLSSMLSAIIQIKQSVKNLQKQLSSASACCNSLQQLNPHQSNNMPIIKKQIIERVQSSLPSSQPVIKKQQITKVVTVSKMEIKTEEEKAIDELKGKSKKKRERQRERERVEKGKDKDGNRIFIQ